MERSNNKKLILQIIIVTLFPFLGSVLYCVIRGVNFFELYLPNSYNNDVLFYYKLVEGLTNGGINGFFGFNESRAIYGGFAAWNPLIVFPWALWGKIFGWSYLSPIICNIVLFALSLVIYVCLVRPTNKALSFMLIMLMLFPGFWIHLMNGLPEIIVAAHLIIFSALVIKTEKIDNKVYQQAAVIISIFLTIIRPYMVLFLLGALLLLLKNKKIWYTLESIFALVITGLGYFLTNHYLTAAYFEDLFDLRIIKALLKFRFKDAYYMCGAALRSTLPDIWLFLKETFKFGSTAGTQYFLALISALFIIILLCLETIAKKKDNVFSLYYLIYSVSSVGLIASIILFLGKANEGGRHCFAFSVLGIILLSNYASNKLGLVLNTVLSIFLVIFIVRGSMVPTDYDIPMPNNELAENVEYWQEVMHGDSGQGYDNTVIWLIFDVANDNLVVTDYHEIYGIPAGMGISCCEYGYVLANIDNLKSKYVAVASGGTTDEMLKVRDCDEIGRTDNLVIYSIR